MQVRRLIRQRELAGSTNFLRRGEAGGAHLLSCNQGSSQDSSRQVFKGVNATGHSKSQRHLFDIDEVSKLLGRSPLGYRFFGDKHVYCFHPLERALVSPVGVGHD
ncbi:hypothetical protein FB476_1291 [Ornithinimicrobium humiphilum]|uniref:Uncharacterized protein n=1 Tax=Ornithinimicrobium humiphilum TaxID=125288 RepID=A0A543KMW3_9MICO|nr:hypothetical protein FB476_1291 [Ornithinimicrobium humiphilum]